MMGEGVTSPRRLLAGDPVVTRDVYARVRRIVGSRAYGLPSDLREDVVQEITIELWRTIGKPGFDLDRELWGFVEVMAVRRCIDAFRRHRPMSEVNPEQPGTADDPLQAALSEERRQQVRRAVAGLSEDCRTLIRDRIEGGRSFKTIADTRGSTEGALRVRFHRCVARAREIFLSSGGTA